MVITICWVAFRWTQMDSPKLAGTLRSGQRRNDLGGKMTSPVNRLAMKVQIGADMENVQDRKLGQKHAKKPWELERIY